MYTKTYMRVCSVNILQYKYLSVNKPELMLQFLDYLVLHIDRLPSHLMLKINYNCLMNGEQKHFGLELLYFKVNFYFSI